MISVCLGFLTSSLSIFLTFFLARPTISESRWSSGVLLFHLHAIERIVFVSSNTEKVWCPGACLLVPLTVRKAFPCYGPGTSKAKSRNALTHFETHSYNIRVALKKFIMSLTVLCSTASCGCCLRYSFCCCPMKISAQADGVWIRFNNISIQGSLFGASQL